MSGSALIESTIKRLNGTVVDFDDASARDGKSVYHFKDDGLGRHVSMVSNPDHIARFLSIPEGFRLVLDQASEPAAAQAPVPIKAKAEPAAAQADAITQGAVTAETQAGENTAIPSDAPVDEINALRAEYQELTGKAPSPRSKLETLKAQIDAFRSAAAG